jgi:hypothetical protein
VLRATDLIEAGYRGLKWTRWRSSTPRGLGRRDRTRARGLRHADPQVPPRRALEREAGTRNRSDVPRRLIIETLISRHQGSCPRDPRPAHRRADRRSSGCSSLCAAADCSWAQYVESKLRKYSIACHRVSSSPLSAAQGRGRSSGLWCARALQSVGHRAGSCRASRSARQDHECDAEGEQRQSDSAGGADASVAPVKGVVGADDPD